jgi:hypothetical protein
MKIFAHRGLATSFQKEVALHMKVQLTQELMGLSVMSA